MARSLLAAIIFIGIFSPVPLQAAPVDCAVEDHPLARAICGDPVLGAFAERLEESWEEALSKGALAEDLLAIDRRHQEAAEGCEGGFCWGRFMRAADDERRRTAGLPLRNWLGYLSALEDMAIGKGNTSTTMPGLGRDGWRCDVAGDRLACINAIGNPMILPREAENWARAKRTLIMLGCAEGVIDADIPPEAAACFHDLTGQTENILLPDDLAILAAAWTASDREEALRELSARGVASVQGSGSLPPAGALAFPLSLDGAAPPALVPPKPKPIDRTIHSCSSEKDCRNSAGRRVDLTWEENRTVVRQQGLKILGCSTRRLNARLLAEEVNCVQRIFGLTEGPAGDRENDILEVAGQQKTAQSAVDRLLERGWKPKDGWEPPKPPPPAVRAPAPPRVRPLDRVTREISSRRLSTTPRPADGRFSTGSPTDEDMRLALERRFLLANVMLNVMQDSCDDFQRHQNTLSALGCLASEAMGMRGEQVGYHITGIDAKGCIRWNEGSYLCEITMKTSGNMGNNPFLRAAMAIYASGVSRPIAFRRISGQWNVYQLYTECDYQARPITCTYVEGQ